MTSCVLIQVAGPSGGKVDQFERIIKLEGTCMTTVFFQWLPFVAFFCRVGNLTPEQRQKLLEAADHCPVHKTLSSRQARLCLRAFSTLDLLHLAPMIFLPDVIRLCVYAFPISQLAVRPL